MVFQLLGVTLEEFWSHDSERPICGPQENNTHTHTDLGYSSHCALKHRGGDDKSMPSDPKEPTVSLSVCVCVFEREKDF